MQANSSSVPVPDPGREPGVPQPQVPKPSIVPPREPKRRRAKWALIAAFVLIAGGLAFYLNSQAAVKTGGGAVITVPTTPAVVSDLRQTVRVTGSVSAEHFVSLLAPRIQGSRSNTNRGGMGGAMTAGPGGGVAVAAVGGWWRWRVAEWVALAPISR